MKSASIFLMRTGSVNEPLLKGWLHEIRQARPMHEMKYTG